MKDKITYIIIAALGLVLMINGSIGMSKVFDEQEERIQMLEQSLDEQIQEKELYINMLEEKNEI